MVVFVYPSCFTSVGAADRKTTELGPEQRAVVAEGPLYVGDKRKTT